MKRKNWTIRIIKPDGTEEGWQGDRHPTLGEMQAWVGGYIEHLTVSFKGRSVDALVNEEGKLNGLPRNYKATTMIDKGSMLLYPDIIHGNMVVFEKGRLE